MWLHLWSPELMVDFHCWRTNGKKIKGQTPKIVFPLFYSLRLVLRSIYTFANASAQTPSTPGARACWSSLIPLALWHYITLHDHPSLMGQAARWRKLLPPHPGCRYSATTAPLPRQSSAGLCTRWQHRRRIPRCVCVQSDTPFTHFKNLFLARRSTSLETFIKVLPPPPHHHKHTPLHTVFKLFGNIQITF